MKEAFSQPCLSDRLTDENMALEEKLIREDFLVSTQATKIFGNSMKNEGIYGIGNGPYNIRQGCSRL